MGRRQLLFPVGGCQFNKMSGRHAQIAVLTVAGGQVPGGMAGKAEKGHLLPGRDGIRVGDQSAAHPGSNDINDGFGPGSLKQYIGH